MERLILHLWSVMSIAITVVVFYISSLPTLAQGDMDREAALATRRGELEKRRLEELAQKQNQAEVDISLIETIEYNPLRPESYYRKNFGTVQAFDFSAKTHLLAALVQYIEPPSPSFLIVIDLRKSKVVHRIELTKTKTKNLGAVRGISLSPDGTVVALPMGNERMASIYNIKTGIQAATFKTDGSSLTAQWNPDGSSLAIMSANAIEHVELGKFERLGYIPARHKKRDRAMAIGWSPDGKTIAVGNSSPMVYIYDPSRKMKSPSLSPLDHTPYRIKWSPSGEFLSITGLEPESGMHIFKNPASMLTVTGVGHNAQTQHVKKIFGIRKKIGGAIRTHINSSEWDPKGKFLAYADSSAQM